MTNKKDNASNEENNILEEELKEKEERTKPLSLEDEDYDLWIFKMFYERK